MPLTATLRTLVGRTGVPNGALCSLPLANARPSMFVQPSAAPAHADPWTISAVKSTILRNSGMSASERTAQFRRDDRALRGITCCLRHWRKRRGRIDRHLKLINESKRSQTEKPTTEAQARRRFEQQSKQRWMRCRKAAGGTHEAIASTAQAEQFDSFHRGFRSLHAAVVHV
ncbi:hypothetical protein BV20DRAFT_968752 [Pilatotrama ljubarskyi]|nr:hypothetical protein BV20DRAFT_968752 [Pilatotrama ljubarskyi]